MTDLVQSDNLAIRLLDLSELRKEVPEAGLGNDIIRSEDAHAVQLRCRVGITGQMAPNDLIFLQAAC